MELSLASTDPRSRFLEEFPDFIGEHLIKWNSVLIAGDININMLSNSSEKRAFQRILKMYNLTQHVVAQTHESGSLLDVLITKTSDSAVVTASTERNYISDHSFVAISIDKEKPPFKREVRETRSVKKIRSPEFRELLQEKIDNILFAETDSNTSDANKLACQYNDALSQTLDAIAPTTKKVITIRPKVEWFNDDLKMLKLEKRKAERKWYATKQPSDKESYKLACRKYTNKLKSEKHKYLNRKIKECGRNQQKLFACMFQMMGRVKDNPMPESDTDLNLAETFNSFFYNKIQKIRDSLENEDLFQPTTQSLVSMNEFKQMSESNIHKLVMTSKASTCRSDPCNTTIVKENLVILSPLITKIINTSLSEAAFPDAWKTSNIIPLLKKKGLAKDYKNYRPVNNLPFISKIAEKAALGQLNTFLQENSLLPDYLSAYRQGYSTETLLIRLHHDILMAMDQKRVIAVAALDLSAAFDTVDHRVLLNVMKTSYGVDNLALRWFTSYLVNRKARVCIGSEQSTAIDVPFSVPQGSCAGPVLYNLYCSTLKQYIEEYNIDIKGYADDTLACVSFVAGDKCEELSRIKDLERSLVRTNRWMSLNRLKMNADKSEFTMFGNEKQLMKCETSELSVNGQTIPAAAEMKFLGVWLDTGLTMKKQVLEVCNNASKILYCIRKIRQFLTIEACQSLVLALVISKLDYANALYISLPESVIKPLQRMQNIAAKLCLNRKKYDSNTECLRILHWLPIKARIEFKVCAIIHKCVHSVAPSYLSELFQLKQYTRVTRQSFDHTLLVTKATNCKTYGDRSIAIAGSKLWNQLPTFLRECEDEQKFKKLLKTHLFVKYL